MNFDIVSGDFDDETNLQQLLYFLDQHYVRAARPLSASGSFLVFRMA